MAASQPAESAESSQYADSRTATVGRKRGLEGLTQDHQMTAARDADADDFGRSNKRVKAVHDTPSCVAVGESSITDAASTSQVSPPAKIEAVDIHFAQSSEKRSGLISLRAEADDLESHSSETQLNALVDANNVEKPVDLPAELQSSFSDEQTTVPSLSQITTQPPSGTNVWNAGLPKYGLRTSFASKERLRRKPLHVSHAAHEAEGQKQASPALPAVDTEQGKSIEEQESSDSPLSEKQPGSNRRVEQSSSDGHEGNGDNDGPMNTTEDPNNAFLPLTIHHPLFCKRLPKKETRKLSRQAKRDYLDALEVWQVEKRRQRDARRVEKDSGQQSSISSAAGQNNQPSDSEIASQWPVYPMPFKKLSKPERKKLSAQEKANYIDAIALWDKDRVRSEKEQMAADLPRIRGSQEFTDAGRQYVLPEVFGEAGNPLPAFKFSYNAFLPIFMEENLDQIDSIKKHTAAKAFKVYVTKFYGHVKPVPPQPGNGCFAPSAHNIDQIRAQVLQVARHKIQLTDHQSKKDVAQPITVITESTTVVPSIADAESEQQALPGAETLQSGPNVIDLSEQVEAKDVSGFLQHKQTHDREVAEVVVIEETNDHSPAESGEISTYSDLGEEELKLQQRYFPSADNTPRCIVCAQTGHKTTNCPSLRCVSCNGSHSVFLCPDNKRCQKCREHGHDTRVCPEKLALPTSEMSCDLCNSSMHLEGSCHLIWRTYDPKPEECLRVVDIPIDCYSCGGSGHFGPECGIRRPGAIASGGHTWSRDNLRKYVDSGSQKRALSAGTDYSIPSRRGISIKGRGAVDPIELDDEDDEESFIRPRVVPAVRAGNIQFGPSSNQSIVPNGNGRFVPGPSQSMQPNLTRSKGQGSAGRGGGNSARGRGGFSRAARPPNNSASQTKPTGVNGARPTGRNGRRGRGGP